MAAVAGPADEWRRAQECLAAAELCRDNGLYADAVSRSYYAILHAAKAALLPEVQVDSHNGVVSQFSLHLVHKGKIEPEWVRYISQSQSARRNADYKVEIIFTLADAQLACANAAAFLNRIHSLLGMG